MTKKVLSILVLASMSLMATAQTAREVLDATAALLSEKEAIRATFRATQFKGTKPQSETSGTMFLMGSKFKMRTETLTVWFDGKQQWSMLKDASEVNLTEPTPEELAQTNPASLIGIYKHGYSASLAEGTLRGKPTYIVTLSPTSSSAAYQSIILDIERATNIPLCVRAKQKGNWMRLAIMTFDKGQKMKQEDFTFQKKSFPKVEIIDLR